MLSGKVIENFGEQSALKHSFRIYGVGIEHEHRVDDERVSEMVVRRKKKQWEGFGLGREWRIILNTQFNKSQNYNISALKNYK